MSIPRAWIQQSMSHPFKLPWIAMLDCLQETIDTIVSMRERKDDDVLKSLELALRTSVDDSISIASDITMAETWYADIANILFWDVDNKWKRNSDDYRKRHSSSEIRYSLSQYIFNLSREKDLDSPKEREKFKNRSKRKYSDFLCWVIDHIRKTYNNWNEHLFTCYDNQYLPNTNLELEISHSRMKRKHRKMTWLKNSHKYLLIHWEHFSHIFDQIHSNESMLNMLQSAKLEQLKVKTKEELLKSKQRSNSRMTIKNISKRLEEISEGWEC